MMTPHPSCAAMPEKFADQTRIAIPAPEPETQLAECGTAQDPARLTAQPDEIVRCFIGFLSPAYNG